MITYLKLCALCVAIFLFLIANIRVFESCSVWVLTWFWHAVWTFPFWIISSSLSWWFLWQGMTLQYFSPNHFHLAPIATISIMVHTNGRWKAMLFYSIDRRGKKAYKRNTAICFILPLPIFFGFITEIF